VDPAQWRELLQECRHAGLKLWIVRGARHQHPDAPHSLLLRPRRERPRRRAAEQRNELAAPHHSITSSARARRVDGTSRPSDLAVLRLTTSSNLVGCSTGNSAGLVPFKIRSTYKVARRS